jgi:hypothetical protein
MRETSLFLRSTSGDQNFYEIVTLFRQPALQDLGRARTAGNRFARDDKELGSQLEEIITRRERPRETAET